jgi:CheY-like chemotaxis protein
MGGTLDFASEPGQGSTFWFELPLPAGEPVAPAPPPPEQPALTPVAPGVKGGTRVLLADDAEMNQEVGRALLEGMGYEVDVVRTGAEAVDAVQRGGYDIVLMDCLMPEMDGYEATAHIRHLEGPVRHIPIIAVTAAAMSGDRERCLAAGMDDYVSKPLDPETLLAALERCRPGRTPAPARQPGSDENSPEHELIHALRSLERKISPEAFGKVLKQVVSSTPTLLAELDATVAAGDEEGTRIIAHKLKGSMASIGAFRLSGLAGQVERLSPGDDGLADLTAEMDEEFARVRQVVVSLAPIRESA